MSISRKALVCARDDSGPIFNTLLHAAIHANEVARAVEYVNIDASEIVNDTIVNTPCGGNTPLIFALKKGNMAVVHALLDHPLIDVHAVDSHGMSALHWACMLRQDAVIERLLDRGADASLTVALWGRKSFIKETPIEPFSLYSSQLRESVFKRFLGERVFIDVPGLFLCGERAWTDVIFHMAELCQNLGWERYMLADKKFITMDEALSSEKMFTHNFAVSYESLCRCRNEIPLNEALITRLKFPYQDRESSSPRP